MGGECTAETARPTLKGIRACDRKCVYISDL